MDGLIYFIEFKPPLGSKRHRARFYCGWTRAPLPCRITAHMLGLGAAITAWAAKHNVQMTCIHSEPGTRADERRIKRQKNHARYLRQKGAIL